MNAERLNLFAVAGAAVKEEVVDFRDRFLIVIPCHTGMDGRPSKDGFHGSFPAVDDHPHGRRDLVVDTPVALQVYESFRRDIVHEPADLIGMCFQNDLEGSIRIDHASCRSVWISELRICPRFDVIHPHLLACPFEPDGRWIIDVFAQEIVGRFRDCLLCF